MGNCLKERKPPLSLFDPHELAALNQNFDALCDLHPVTRKRRALSQSSFLELFPENPEFAKKLFRILEVYGHRENYISREVLFSALECLIKDAAAAPELKTLDRLELTTLIALKTTQFLVDKEDLHALRIPYLDAVLILNDLLRMRLATSPLQTVDERVTRAFLDQLYIHNAGLLEWFELVRHLKAKLKGLPAMLKAYFQHKFMGKALPILAPSLQTESYLINEDWLFQLHMAAFNSKLHNAAKLELLYSNRVHQGGFQQMIDAIVGCALPTLLVCQHEETYQALLDRSLISKSNIFGAISNQRWFDTAQAQGDNSDCIFQMCPNFIVYPQKREKTAKKHFCYLNTLDKSKPIGLGFGYDAGKCRIWIDRDMLNKSYVTAEDPTYEKGDLVGKHIKQLQQLSVIEVWAIVHAAPEESISLMEEPVAQQELLTSDDKNLNSNADYYWVKKQAEKKEEVGLFADFYWMKGKQERAQGKATSKAPTKPSDTQIARLLVGESQQQSSNFESQKVTSTIRRSNMARPVLDFKESKARSSYNPPSVPLYQSSSPMDRNQIFGTTLDETVTVTKHQYQSQAKGRKTVDEVIKAHEQRNSARKAKLY